MRLAACAALIAATATVAAVLLRMAPTHIAPQAITATLFLSTAAAVSLRAAPRERQAARGVAALTAGAATACGIVAGTMRWPSSDMGWLFALIYAWLAARLAHLGAVAHTLSGPILGAQALPYGVVIHGARTTSYAWMLADGTIMSNSQPGGVTGALRAHLALLHHAVIRPLLNGQAPRLLSTRRLHAAEHLAVTRALDGCPPDPESLAGDPITPLCGGTIAAIAVPVYVAAGALSPRSLQAAALLWAMCIAYALRTAATTSGRLRWLLAPGLWLQRLTTATPGPAELRVACAAVAACMQPDTSG